MKKIIKTFTAVLLALAMILSFAGCGTKTLHCDGCGKEVKVDKSSNMEENWTVYCKECSEKYGLDKLPE